MAVLRRKPPRKPWEESAHSESYEKGKTVGYKWRVRGPVFPVKTVRKGGQSR